MKLQGCNRVLAEAVTLALNAPGATRVWRRLGRASALVVALVSTAVAPSGAQQAPIRTPAAPGGWGTIVAPSPPAKPQRQNQARPSPEPIVPAPPPATAPKAARAPEALRATAAQLSGDRQRTRLAIAMSGRTTLSAYRMSEPYRIVIDLAGVEFALPAGTGRDPYGVITAFRYGLIAPGKSRIVIDTAGPVRIERVQFDGPPSNPELQIDLIPTSAAEFAADELAAAASGIDVANPAPPKTPEKPAVAKARPVIVIDPGHGGIDSGAEGTLGLEKDVVLAVARKIQATLLASRRFDVVLTRNSDVFLSLDERVRLSMRHHADLFLSIHADSLAARELAQHVRGASLYILSEKASDDRARRMAEKENAADLLAGLQFQAAATDQQVRDILVDLMRRESATLSSEFRSLLLTQMRTRLTLTKDPARSAPFKVLRQPGSPAVLIELGYISNAEEEKLMGTEAWQRTVAQSVAAAVNEYFKRQTARTP